MSALAWLAQPSILPWLALAGGLCVGSFLNVVAHRLPRMMEREWRTQCAELAGAPPPATERYDLVAPRSHCPACRRPIPVRENIPVVSWLLLRGRCAGCGAAIPLRYPLVELAAGLLAAGCAWRWGATALALAAMLYGWTLLALSAIDFETQLLPDSLTLPLAWAGLLVNLRSGFAPLEAAVIGAVAGYLSLWLVYWAFRIATGKEGMGYGDFKLAAAIGAWLGWPMLPVALFVGAFLGAAAGLVWIASGRGSRARPIPFGPWLAAGGLIALFGGEALLGRWLLFA